MLKKYLFLKQKFVLESFAKDHIWTEIQNLENNNII